MRNVKAIFPCRIFLAGAWPFSAPVDEHIATQSHGMGNTNDDPFNFDSLKV